MTRFRFRREPVFAAGLLLLAFAGSPASPLQAQTVEGYRIAGRVLNAETGAPLSRAEVAIIVVPEGSAPVTPSAAPPPGRPRRGFQGGLQGAGRGGGYGNRRRPLPVASQSTLSAEDGSFAFDNVAPGKYSLQGSRRGYITTSYQEHGNYSTAIVAGAGQQTEDLALQLSPGATISGTLGEGSGDPIDQAMVSLYREEEDGLGSIRMYRGARVDETGAWEFAHLPPGTYFVSGAGRVWFAQAGAQAAITSTEGSSDIARFTADAATDLDLVYPRTFYSDASDSASATPIPVHGGERLRIDLRLNAVPAVHLVYTPPAPAAGSNVGFRMPLLSQAAFGEPEFSSPAMSNRLFRTPQDGGGTMVLSVAPGDYDVEVGGRTLSVHASGDLQLDPAAGQPSVELNGRLAPAPGAELPDQVYLSFQGSSSHGGQLTAPVGREGGFHLDSIRAGTYELEAIGAGRPLALMGAAAAGAQIEGNRLTLGSQSATLALTVAPASAIVAGFVRDAQPAVGSAPPGASNLPGAAANSAAPSNTPSGSLTPPTGKSDPADVPAARPEGSADRPASGVMVVLVPEHLSDHALFRRDQSDSDGSFSLRDCAPGRYTALAIRDGWDLDWARPAVIRHYLPGGQPVTIPANTRTVVRLPRPLIAQPR